MQVIVPDQVNLPPDILSLVKGSRLAGSILWQRGYRTVGEIRAFLDPAFYQPVSPASLPGINEALDVLRPAVSAGERICVYGDYDVDGVTATALLVMTLKSLGADVIYHVPNRFTEGYGMNTAVVRDLAEQGCRVILTCDCGISSHEAVQLAKDLGLKVVVTDHHSLPESEVPADVIFNPKYLPDNHPCRDLPGVGAAYMLAKALGTELGYFADVKALQLVALGTVADVVPLTGENRYYLQLGLDYINSANRLAGIAALIKASNICDIDEETVAFQVAPRLNAPGRLDSADICVELLLSESVEQALPLARAIDGLNNRRRQLVEAVMEDLRDLKPDGSIIMFNRNWHQGIIGIAAGRLAETFGVPVVLLTLIKNSQTVTGSARAAAGVDIFAGLANVRTYLDKFGGHKQAAGLALPLDNLDDFIKAAKMEIDRRLFAEAPKAVAADARLEFDNISLGVYNQLRLLAPFGEGNPAPLFFTPEVRVDACRNIGKDGGHLRLVLHQKQQNHPAVWWWNSTPQPAGSFANALYTLNCHDYNGIKSVQLVISNLFPAEVKATAAKWPALEIIDARYTPGASVSLPITGAACYYAEGRPAEPPELNRYAIYECDTLVLKSIPPHLRVLKEMIALAKCRRLVLGYPNQAADEPFLLKLMGVLKSEVRRSRITSLEYLAAATGDLEIAVVMGLRLLRDAGYLSWEAQGTRIEFTLLPGERISSASNNYRLMNQAEQETKAFREFMRSSRIDVIIKTIHNG